MSYYANINAIQSDMISAGPGIRTEIFFHGCTRGCPGCINDWTLTYPYRCVSVLGIVRELQRLENKHITISGGEPMEQYRAVVDLLQRRYSYSYPNGSILMYTGYSMEEIIQHGAYYTLRALNYIVTDPYIEALAYEKIEDSFVGSSNQRFWRRKPGIYTSMYGPDQETMVRNCMENDWELLQLDQYGRWIPSEQLS